MEIMKKKIAAGLILLNKTEIKVQIMQFLFNCSPSDRPFLPLLKSFLMVIQFIFLM